MQQVRMLREKNKTSMLVNNIVGYKKGKFMITAVNPAIIQWARERSGLSLDDLAQMMKRDPVKLQQWEDGILDSHIC